MWLFSPVVGQKYPGDVWGVDDTGQLILVETKFGRHRKDPFANFVGFSDVLARAVAIYGSTALKSRWDDLLLQELAFGDDDQALERALSDAVLRRGVVPYSYRRYAVRRWRALYRERIFPWIRSEDYSLAVRERLELLDRSSSREAVYFVLIVYPDGKAAENPLTSQGLENLRRLRDEVEPSRTRLVGLQARDLPDREKVEIRSWTIEV